MNGRAFRIIFYTKLVSDRWKQSEKYFCDDYKTLKKLVKKYKLILDRRNNIGIRKCSLRVEELLNGVWESLEEHPVVMENENFEINKKEEK